MSSGQRACSTSVSCARPAADPGAGEGCLPDCGRFSRPSILKVLDSWCAGLGRWFFFTAAEDGAGDPPFERRGALERTVAVKNILSLRGRHPRCPRIRVGCPSPVPHHSTVGRWRRAIESHSLPVAPIMFFRSRIVGERTACFVSTRDVRSGSRRSRQGALLVHTRPLPREAALRVSPQIASSSRTPHQAVPLPRSG